MENQNSQEFEKKNEHDAEMRKAGVDIDKLIEFRKDVHKHAELAFNEFETQRKIKELLLSYGIEEENIKVCAKTGLVADIKGTGET